MLFGVSNCNWIGLVTTFEFGDMHGLNLGDRTKKVRPAIGNRIHLFLKSTHFGGEVRELFLARLFNSRIGLGEIK